ncbi:[NiFe] hydrogenase metallocenter assembly protein HypC [hydrothermal vent metagenome]|uniref:[NiFe] hydrogenase metallocenter assembly protein HypC n=1 Tax=hydrothermal vent metagenome TaxID=652676 RepID=A0A3B1CSB9_9ZZZZ
MCLAVPMEVTEINDFRGVARMGGVSRDVNLMLVPDVKVGDYVIIHAGSAISILSEQEAKKTLDLLGEIGMDSE